MTTPEANRPLSAEDVGLLPCPFCGGEAELRAIASDHWARCKDCSSETSFCASGSHAVASWNRRIPPLAGGGGDDLEAALKDPATVHINMLRGGIAKPTPTAIGHLYRGDEAREVVAEVQRQNPEAFAPTPSADDAGLIERLKAGTHHQAWTGGSVPEPSHDEFVLINPDGPDAAKRIALLSGDAELFRHMLEVAKANGFGSLTEAIARAVKAESRLAAAVDEINLILPLAKGYAAAHRVGSNAAYVESAEAFLATIQPSDGGE